MKKYLILILFLVFTFSVNAQTTIDTYTVWGDPATPPDDFVLSNGNGLIVNDTLVIYGNLELKNDADIIINTGGVLIIVGDFIAKNQVDLAVGGVIVVTGVFDKTGAAGDITDNGGDIFLFDDDPEWGPGETPVEGVDYGDEDDFINDPIFDIIGDIIGASCTLGLTLDSITDVTTPGGSDGAISITLTGTIDNITWATNDGSGLVIGDEDQTGLTAGTYSVAVEGSNGGSTCFVFGSYTVAEVSCTDPSLSTVTAPEICNGYSYDLSNVVVVDANGTSPTYTYHSGTPALPGNELGSTTISPTTTTTYYILGTNGSCTDELPVDVTVNPLPTVTDQTPADLCSEIAGDSLLVTGLVLTDLETDINAVAATFNWYEDAVLSISVITPASASINDNFGATISATKIFYCEVVDGGCASVATVTYTINRVPETGAQYHIDND